MFIVRTLLQLLILVMHTVIVIVGCAVPVTLALRTIYVDGAWTLEPWNEALASGNLERWLDLLWRTVVIGLTAVVIAVGGGLSLALLGFKFRWFGRAVLAAGVVAGACIPLYVTHSTLIATIDTLRPFGLDRVSLTGSILAAGTLHGLVYVPLAALLSGLGLLAVEPELEEAAVLRCGVVRVITGIVIPRAGWSIGVAAAVVLWLTVTDYAITDVLQVRCFAEEIFTQYALGGERTQPLIIALPMAVLLAAGFIIVGALARGGATRMYTLQRAPYLVRGGWFVGLLGGAVLALSALIITGVVDVMSARLLVVTEPWARFIAILPEWLNTIGVAVVTAVLLAVSAVHVAWMWVRSACMRVPVTLMLLGLVAVPAPALAMTVLGWVSQPIPVWLAESCAARGISVEPLDAFIEWFYNSPAMWVLAISLRFLPLAVIVVLPVVCRVSREQEDAVRIMGGTWSDLLLRVYWPQCRGRALLAGIVVMILAIGELDCAHLVAPPGPSLLSVRLFTFIHNGVNANVVAICTLATLTTLPLAAVLFCALNKRLKA